MKTLCFATHNSHKIKEVKDMMGAGYNVLGLSDIGFHDEIVEDGDTFRENALIKAKTIHRKFDVVCFSDDSGLEVRALGGAPGVLSARYAGENVTNCQNIDKLLVALDGQSDRNARFVTVIAFVDGGGDVHYFEGIVHGTITQSRSGDGGFGYDSVFRPEGCDLTFAQMPPSQKSAMSHRAKAMQQFMSSLKNKNGLL